LQTSYRRQCSRQCPPLSRRPPKRRTLGSAAVCVCQTECLERSLPRGSGRANEIPLQTLVFRELPCRQRPFLGQDRSIQNTLTVAISDRNDGFKKPRQPACHRLHCWFENPGCLWWRVCLARMEWPVPIGQTIGLLVIPLLLGLVFFNGIVMMVSPSRWWFALPRYIAFRGTLQSNYTATRIGRFQIRAFGLILAGATAWMILSFFGITYGS